MQQTSAEPTIIQTPNTLQQGQFTKELLKKHLVEGRYSPEGLFQLYVIQTRAFIFENRPHGAVEEMQFRSAIAASLDLTVNEVFIVGSAQTGFSTKPSAQLRDFDGTFRQTNVRKDKSDVDVAVVSASYFDRLHREMYNFTSGFDKGWCTNVYYPNISAMQHFHLPRVDASFYQYLARGWFRPDLVPDAFVFGFRKPLEEWKRRLDRKISVGIYREWSLLRDYQIKSFIALKDAALKGLI